MCPILACGGEDLYPRSHKSIEITADIVKQFNKAVAEGSYALVKSALEKGIDPDCCVNKASLFVCTPLMVATSNKNLALMELLLNYGARVNYANNQGMTALHIAASKKDPKFIELLISRGADINLKYNGQTANDIAAERANLEVLKAINVARLQYHEAKQTCDAIMRNI